MNQIGENKLFLLMRNIQYIALSGLIFFLPFDGRTSIKEILFSLLAGAFLVEKLPDYKDTYRKSLAFRSVHILIILSFLWAFASLIYAVDPSYSLHEIVAKMPKQYLLYFIAFFMVQEITHGKLKSILIPLSLSAMVMAFYACYQFYQYPAFFVNRVPGFTGAFYRLATLLVLSIPIMTILAFISKGWMKRVLFLSSPFLLAALFFTFTRGAWLSVIIEMVILFFLFMRKYTKLVLAGVITVILIIAALSYKSIISHTLITRGSEQPRIEAIKLSTDIIRSYPFTGIGYGKETFSKYYPDTYVKHAHNVFLNTAVETGIVGAAILILLFGVILKNFTLGIRSEIIFEKKLILSGVFASFVGFLCLNTFDYMYHGWPGQICWTLIGIGHGLIQSTAMTREKPVSD
jgi:putative inorganic carbon (hco3(-)) transporter